MRYYKIIVCAVLVTASACTSTKDEGVEGIVGPPNTGARIIATQNGRAIAVVDVNGADGKFTMALQPGTYDIKVTFPASSFPLSFPGVVVEPGRTTTLPLIDPAMPTGQAVLAGKIVPGGAGTKVSLLYEGKERAAVNTNAEGKYEFAGLPAGNYTLQAGAPGYAADAATINLSDAQRATLNIRLLYISKTDGVDWTAGKIRAAGAGMPPKNSTNTTVSREMAKRAALANAQRNLLKALDQIRVSPDQSLKSFVGAKSYTEKIQGFIQGYKIVREKERSDGTVEIEIELPLTGPGGLSTVVRERQP